MTYCRQLFPLLYIVSILSGQGENPPPPASLNIQGGYAARLDGNNPPQPMPVLHLVEGYINETTDPTIEITYDPALNGDEDLSTTGIVVFVNSDCDGLANGWFPTNWVNLENEGFPAQTMGPGNTIEIQIPYSILNSITAFPDYWENCYVDFYIAFETESYNSPSYVVKYFVNWGHNIEAFEDGTDDAVYGDNDFLMRDMHVRDIRDKVNRYNGWSGKDDDNISFSLQQINIHP